MDKKVLSEVHKIEMDILHIIVEICKRHNLTYFLYEGSLLGAIRHSGFIPWDDDIDIAMPRNDYEKFIEIATMELPDYLVLQTMKTDPHWGKMFSKIRNVNTIFKSKNDGENYISYGIFVDIFPLDNIEKSGDKISFIKEKMVKTIKTHLIMCLEKRKKNLQHKILSVIPLKLYMYIYGRLITKDGQYFTCYGSEYGIRKETFNKDLFYPAKMHCFEDIQISIPNNYDVILKRIYGDNYMELPPEEKRYTHAPEIVSIDKGVVK